MEALSLDYANAPRYAKSRELYKAACQVIPSGVNSTARAVWSGWDPHPLFVAEGQGSRLEDVDGNVYIDYLLGLGPMILGHRPPKVTAAVVDFIQNNGTVFALPHAEETKLARKMIAAVPSLEQLRLCNTGTEAVLYAVRLARAFTGRNKVIRFEGMYHGFSDGVYWSKHPSLNMAGPDSAPVPVPQGPGLPAGIGDSLIILPWNDTALLREVLEREGHDIAAVITEPVMCNTGCILPEPGYLEAMRELTAKYGVLLVFDEVITGFRIAFGGAQGHYGITPDLSTFAKGMGGGFPVAALGGRKDVMALVADGTVSMAGTYSANGIAVAAANAALDELAEPGKYERLHAVSDRLRHGLTQILAEAKLKADVVGVGPVLQVWFTDHPIRNYREAARHARHDLFRMWWEGMLDRGVLFHPGAFENLFVSFAHTEADIDQTLAAAKETARAIRAKA
jgi:glutamate-1-semialdehyde 2,1-aminomutase